MLVVVLVVTLMRMFESLVVLGGVELFVSEVWGLDGRVCWLVWCVDV